MLGILHKSNPCLDISVYFIRAKHKDRAGVFQGGAPFLEVDGGPHGTGGARSLFVLI